MKTSENFSRAFRKAENPAVRRARTHWIFCGLEPFRNLKRLVKTSDWPERDDALVLLLSAAPASADTLAYVVTDPGGTPLGEFGTVDLTTGAHQQFGPGEPDGYGGLASGPNGSLVSATYAGDLVSINPAAGVPTEIGAISSLNSAGQALGGFDGRIYVTDAANSLYLVSPLTGAAKLLAQTTVFPPRPSSRDLKTLMALSTSLTKPSGDLREEEWHAAVRERSISNCRSVLPSLKRYAPRSERVWGNHVSFRGLIVPRRTGGGLPLRWPGFKLGNSAKSLSLLEGEATFSRTRADTGWSGWQSA